MTNEQTAILLEGYLVELQHGIEETKCHLEPTMIPNNSIIVGFGGRKELEVYEQLEDINVLVGRLRRDIEVLRGEDERPLYVGDM